MSGDATRTEDFALIGSRRGPGPAGEDAGLVLIHAPDPAGVPHVVELSTTAPLVIGREPPSGGLAIVHSGVSRVHARLHHDGRAWIVTDLDSRNGTLVNGLRVETSELEELDELRIGDAIYVFLERGIAQHAGHRIDREVKPDELVAGPRLLQILDGLRAIAHTDLPVLVLGETGTGKELAAHAVHAASERRGRFCALNCAALPTAIAESELYGHRRGAFTGADRDKLGLIATADGGTLFLDEIGELALEAQAKLLRVLETGELLPLGASVTERVDVRVVAATNRDLREQVKRGAFRADLLARLSGHVAIMPPLRERKTDLVPLIRHLFAKHGRPETPLAPAAAVALCHHDWPYNVRELESLVRRAVALLDSRRAPPHTPLELTELPEALLDALEGYGEPAKAEVAPRASAPELDVLRDALVRHSGNVAAVARELGKDRNQIHRWMRRYELDPRAFRS